MALSNWDLLAIGKDGKSCDGIVKGKHASLEIYKNWGISHLKICILNIVSLLNPL